MPATNPFTGDPDRDFTDSDWKQAVADVDPGGGDNFSSDGGGESTLAGVKVPFNKLQAFHRYWLGYQQCVADGVGGVVLKRTLPKTHPLWPELTADYVHTVAYKPDANVSQESALLGLKRKVTPALSTTVPYFAGYKSARATIGFKDLPYELLDDSGVSGVNQWQRDGDTKYGTPSYSFPAEWLRFTEIDPAPRIEILSLDGFTLCYADGKGNSSPTTNPAGPNTQGQPNSTPAPVGQLLVKADLALTTSKLPQGFLFKSGEVLPRNILAALGKVNRYTLFNKVPGTLLFCGVELSRRRFSLRASSVINESKYLWKARYLFSFFDPPTGFNNDETTSTTQLRGHNNLFWIGARNDAGALSSGDKNSMKWFFATASGNPNDPGLIPTFDLAQLWKPVTDDAGTTVNPCYDVGPTSI